MPRPDPHSYFDREQPRTRALDLKLNVDFASQRLGGEITLTLDRPGSGALDLDTKGLTITAVHAEDGRPVPFRLDDDDPILGRRLHLELPPDTLELTIAYSTSPTAVALQWLAPAQTEGGRHPFLFSQCQAIHARTLAPLQDSPAARVTYRAALTVPEPLTAVMSAAPAGVRPGDLPGTRTFLFDMPQPIPPYLLALAVGELVARDLSPRSRVWAEPGTVEKAAWEFAEVERLLGAAERLFGPYDWERYDMLVLPPSFPFGGMENPRMTFLTPTLLAGDRSLVDVVAHELAHSWTGNLISNASADHFWLNEGFTVWAERRIHEALHGADGAALAWAIGGSLLAKELERFGPGSPLTRLRGDLRGVDPDDAFSSIPYEKGARFLVAIERAAGRPAFDAFVREYIARFRFTSITTEDFLAFLDQKLPGVATAVDAAAWLDQPGMPAVVPDFPSLRLDQLGRLAAGFATGARPAPEEVGSWSPGELLFYLQRLPRPLAVAELDWLDRQLALTARGNHDILVEWLAIAAASDYAPAFDRIRSVVLTVGRMKYLRPLYTALGGNPRTRALARTAFAGARERYHAIARHAVEAVIAKYPE